MINFYGPINYLGYGIHNYNLMKAYSKLSDRISLTPPFGRITFRTQDVDKWIENQKLMSKNDVGLMIFDAPFLNQFSGKIRIGFPVFETDKFTEHTKASMRNCDYLLTPSKWGQEIIKKELNLKAKVIPEGYDPTIFYDDQTVEYKLHRIQQRGHITFIHVGKIEKRKGTLDIIDCFDKVFTENDKYVVLKLRINNMFDGDWKQRTETYLVDKGFANQGGKYFTKGKLTIELLPEANLSFYDMAKIYKDADFGIWLSKAEGWNLPLMECIACGVPTLTTNVTGMTEYLEDYPEELKLKTYEKEIANDGTFFKGDKGNWYCPDLQEVCDNLKNIIDNYEDYISKSNACTEAIKEFTWDNAALKLQSFIKEVK